MTSRPRLGLLGVALGAAAWVVLLWRVSPLECRLRRLETAGHDQDDGHHHHIFDLPRPSDGPCWG